MRFKIKSYTSPDYPSPESAARAAGYMLGAEVYYDYDGGGFVSPGDRVEPVAVKQLPPMVYESGEVEEEDDYDGDIW